MLAQMRMPRSPLRTRSRVLRFVILLVVLCLFIAWTRRGHHDSTGLGPAPPRRPTKEDSGHHPTTLDGKPPKGWKPFKEVKPQISRRKKLSRFLTKSRNFFWYHFLPHRQVILGPLDALGINVDDKELTLPRLRKSRTPRRLVVFGDSWSDNGKSPTATKPLAARSAWMPWRRDTQEEGLYAWTEGLCKALACTQHDNFAVSEGQIKGRVGGRASLGDLVVSTPVVDQAILDQTLGQIAEFNSSLLTEVADLLRSQQKGGNKKQPTTEGEHGRSTEDIVAPDFATQVEQWIDFDRTQPQTKGRKSSAEVENTVFVVWFSLWDIWYYSSGDLTIGTTAVQNTMDALFTQLKIISEHTTVKPTIIIPEAMDITYLPRWAIHRTTVSGPDKFASEQRSAIRLTAQWNRMLRQKAQYFQHASIYVHAANTWLADQMLETQLSYIGATDYAGLGTRQSPWQQVKYGCMGNAAAAGGGTAADAVCESPDTHLFWDDIHLGRRAARMLARDVAMGLASEKWFAERI